MEMLTVKVRRLMNTFPMMDKSKFEYDLNSDEFSVLVYWLDRRGKRIGNMVVEPPDL